MSAAMSAAASVACAKNTMRRTVYLQQSSFPFLLGGAQGSLAGLLHICQEVLPGTAGFARCISCFLPLVLLAWLPAWVGFDKGLQLQLVLDIFVCAKRSQHCQTTDKPELACLYCMEAHTIDLAESYLLPSARKPLFRQRAEMPIPF